MIKDFKEIIDAVCDRFNNSLSQLDIIAWLENFDSTDWKKALNVLNSFEYYSSKDIINEYEIGLKNIIEDLKPKEKIFLKPVGRVGKSGTAMIYYLKKTPSFSNKNVILIENESFIDLTDDCKIVLVDDFSGSGGSILEYYEKIKPSLPEKHTPIALTIVFMEKAENALDRNNIKIVGNKRLPAFSRRGSVFGYYPKMKAIRNFCFEYGNKLYPEERYKTGATKQHPLGYSNTQALIGFEHSIPNNTLSIIWADVKDKETGMKWNPLFPRRGGLIIDRAKEFKQNQRYWTSIVYKLGLNETLFLDDEKYNSQTVQHISIIYLKRKKKNDLTICQMLGLNLKEYEAIVMAGQKKNLFDENEELTEQSINIFEQIKRRIKFQNNSNLNADLALEEDMLYIPKKFRGGS